jgi:hypothetical protein
MKVYEKYLKGGSYFLVKNGGTESLHYYAARISAGVAMHQLFVHTHTTYAQANRQLLLAFAKKRSLGKRSEKVKVHSQNYFSIFHQKKNPKCRK